MRNGNDKHGDLVVLGPEGLYCPQGDFHIDPWRPVPRAVITHGHLCEFSKKKLQSEPKSSEEQPEPKD